MKIKGKNMEQSVKESCDLRALKVYAIQLGISKERVVFCFNKEEIYNLISEKLNQILEKNKIYPTSTYLEFCAFAESIGALTTWCETNNIPCVLSAIHQKILELNDNHYFQFNEYLTNLKELNKLIKIKEDENLERTSRITNQPIKNPTSSNDHRMKL